jgi:PAS domain S-box-containing protein
LTNPLKGWSFQSLFDAAADAMLLVDEKGVVVVANIVAQQQLGYSAAEICGLAVEELMPARHRTHHHQLHEHYIRKPKKRSIGNGKQLLALKKNGTEFAVDIVLSPIKNGKKLHTLVTLYAKNQRRLAEESFETSEEHLQLAKEAAGLGVFNFDSNQNVLHWDEKMRELWGAESMESIVAHQRFITAIHPDDRAARQAALDAAINPSGNGQYHAEYRVVNPTNNNKRWVSAVGRMHFEDGIAMRLVGVARDITEQKLSEKKLLEHRTETESLSQQMVAAHTASAIAHELNQPLAAISAYSEVALHALQSCAGYPDNLKRALEGCVEQAQRAGSSLHELLAFLQKGDLITERFDLNEAVKEALNIARSSGYGEFYPMLELDRTLPEVLGNKVQVQKILVNLLRNAVEAMHITRLRSSAITISVRTNSEINMAHVTLQDNGPGLELEMAKHIFEPFFTTKPTGIGMGLAISRALIEANGGQLWLDPHNKTGAMFHFTLPFAP